MILDSTKGDYGYDIFDAATGEEIPYVVRCDDEAGTVTRALKNADGSWQLNAAGDDRQLVTENRRIIIRRL